MNTKKTCARLLPLVSALAVFGTAHLQAQTISTTEHQEIDPQGVSNSARFGRELAMSGDTLIVGAPLHFENQVEDGLVNIYVRSGSTWSLQQTLTDPSPLGGSLFGDSVAIDGDRALIGASRDREMGPGSGAAYIYERTGTTWTQTAKIFDDIPGANHAFGIRVALDGDHALIGGNDNFVFFVNAPNEVHAFSLQGGTWQFDQSLRYTGPPVGPNNPGTDVFGAKIVMDGNRAAILGDLTLQVFTRTGSLWAPEQSLTPAGAPLDVDLDQDLLVISFDPGLSSPNEGAVNVYRRFANAWTLEEELRPSERSFPLSYGRGVDVEGDVIAFGTIGFSINPEIGEVTLFERSAMGWLETLALRTSQDRENDRFGETLAMSNGHLVVGAFLQGPNSVGSAYAFDLAERPVSFCEGDGADQNGCGACPCGNDAPVGSLGGCLNAAGTSATLRASGAASVTDDTLRLELEGGNPSTFAILISGAQRAPNNTMNPCFGTGSGITFSALSGLRCVVQDVRRQGTRAIDINGAVGETNSGWGGVDGPIEGLVSQAGLVAGQTRHYQAFYRETPTVGCMRDQNTTQGISVVVRP